MSTPTEKDKNKETDQPPAPAPQAALAVTPLRVPPVMGGLAVMYRSSVVLNVPQLMVTPQHLAIDLVDLTIICAYLPPPPSPWLRTLDYDPCDDLQALLAIRSCSTIPVIGLGDINGRTASRSSSALVPRVSCDNTRDARGDWFMNMCADLDMIVLNGTSWDVCQPGTWTSFQPMGTAVIDYAWLSADHLDKLKEFKVDDILLCLTLCLCH